MNKRILLVHVAAFVLTDYCAAAVNETSSSAFPKLDHGAQVNGGVRRKLRGNEEIASEEERAGGEPPVFHDFFQLRSNLEEPPAAVRNVPNEWNFQLNEAFINHFAKSGVKMDKVRDKMNLIENHEVSASDENKFLMALGSEYFELLAATNPGPIFPWSFPEQDLNTILQDHPGDQFGQMILNLKKYGVSPPKVLGKIKWLLDQNFGFEQDPIKFLYMAFGSELLRNKPASTSRASWGETLSLAIPGTHVHDHPME